MVISERVYVCACHDNVIMKCDACICPYLCVHCVCVCVCVHVVVTRWENLPSLGKGFGKEAVEFWDGKVSLTLPLDDQSVDDFGEQSSIEGGRGREKQLTVEGGQICKEKRERTGETSAIYKTRRINSSSNWLWMNSIPKFTLYQSNNDGEIHNLGYMMQLWMIQICRILMYTGSNE